MSEKETILILCQPSYELSKIALDFLELGKNESQVTILMLEDADIKFSMSGKQSQSFKILKSNIRKIKTKEIFIISKLDYSRLTNREQQTIFTNSLEFLKKAHPKLKVSGIIYNGITGASNVFK